jgi:O-antigen ligase
VGAFEMLKIPFLSRRATVLADPTWRPDGPPRTIHSLGMSPVVLTLVVALSALFLFGLGGFLALAPIFGVVLVVGLMLLAGFVALIAKLAPGAPWWIKSVFLTISALLVLNVGFGAIFLGPKSAPVPLTDIVLVFALLACATHVFSERNRIHLPWGIWVIFFWVPMNVSIHLPADFEAFGMTAARDAIRIVEMLYIIPGYVVIRIALRSGEQGKRWLASFVYGTAVVMGAYGLLVPVQSTVSAISPAFPGLFKSEPILGGYQTWPLVGLMSIFGVLLWRWALPRKLTLMARLLSSMIVVSGLVAFAVLQSRGAYVFLAVALAVLALIGGQGKQVGKFSGFVALCCAGLLVVQVSGLEFKGRVGQLSLTGIVDHVSTLTGNSRNAEFNGAAGGISQRKAWRDYSLSLWSQSPSTRIFGVGFGRYLTDMVNRNEDGQMVGVQDPHNSFVTMLTRSGLIGLAIMLAVLGWVFYMGYFGYRRFRYTQRPLAAYFLWVMLFQIYCMISAWGEPHYEVAHFLMPSFFIYGATWAVWDFYAAKTPKAGAALGVKTGLNLR